MKKIVVASQNPMKIQAARKGFERMFPKETFEAKGISAESGVSDQPMGEEETYRGAYNRATNAKKAHPTADYWVGIEGGLIQKGQEMETMAWIVVRHSDRLGKARTAGFFLPPGIVTLVQQGYELGHADDIVFGTDNSKQTIGSAGLLTDGAIDRISFYVPAVILALIPFRKPNLFKKPG